MFLLQTACHTNGSCALRVDEVRDRGSPSCEWQYTSQSLLVTRREAQLTFPVFRVAGCDRAGFTFARSAGARGDQNAV